MIPALAVGDRVTHRHYGPGEIVEVVSDISGMLRSNGGFMPVEADAIRTAGHTEAGGQDQAPEEVWVRFRDDAGLWRHNQWRGGYMLPMGAFQLESAIVPSQNKGE